MADGTPKYIVKSFCEERSGDILVRWADYDDPKDYTWEPKRNLIEDLGISYFFLLQQMKETKKKKARQFLK